MTAVPTSTLPGWRAVPAFARVALEVCRRSGELLGAPVGVLDAGGTLVAGEWPPGGPSLELPFEADGQAGIVLVGDPAGEPPSPRLTKVVVELVIAQATAPNVLPDARELKHKFIHDLLRGVERDEETISRQARILGMDLTPPRAVILIDASSYILEQAAGDERRAARRAQLVIGGVVGFFSLPNDTICAYIGGGEVAVLKASDSRNLALWAGEADGGGHEMSGRPDQAWADLAALKRAARALLERLRGDTASPLSLGIGRYHRGVGGLARSYEDARAALTLGRRLSGDGRVHCLDSLGAAAFVGVADEETKLGLARSLLSPLDAEPELLLTLKTFFEEDGQPLRVARRLGIHRNTLSHRLGKVALLTGVDPRRFDQAVQMFLALLLRGFTEGGPAGPPSKLE